MRFGLPRGSGLKIPSPTKILNKASMRLNTPDKTLTLATKRLNPSAHLPSKRAMRMLGDPTQQSLGNYAKLTPSGAAAMSVPYSTIMDQGEQPEVQPALPTDE